MAQLLHEINHMGGLNTLASQRLFLREPSGTRMQAAALEYLSIGPEECSEGVGQMRDSTVDTSTWSMNIKTIGIKLCDRRSGCFF